MIYMLDAPVISGVAKRTESAAGFVAPPITSHTIYDWALEIVLSPTEQAAVLLKKFLHFVGFFRLGSSVVGNPILLQLVVEILVEFTQLLDSVGHTISQILVGLRLLMTLAVNLEEGFVVGADDIDAEAAALRTLRVV